MEKNIESYIRLLDQGNNALSEAKYQDALQYYIAAQREDETQISAYINLALTYRQLENIEDSLKVTLKGLEFDKNSYRLWELLAAIYAEKFGEAEYGDLIKNKATAVNSWVGLLLHCHIAGNESINEKIKCLENFRSQNEIDQRYFAELSALYGQNDQFEKILDLHQEALLQQHLTEEPLDWRIRIHLLQAYFALNKQDEAFRLSQELFESPAIPESVKDEIRKMPEGMEQQAPN